jgi:mycothiol synthase
MTDWTFLADPPPVPGLRFRGFAGDGDFEAMSRVLNAACAADGIDRVERPEDIRRSYRHLDHCDPFTDMVFAEIDGEVAAYGRVDWWEEAGGPRRYLPLCFVHPDARRRGIGTAMLAHNESRLRRIDAGLPPAGERTFLVWYSDVEKGAVALFEQAGYRPIRYNADMVRPDLEDIPEAPMPEGLVVRTPGPEEIRKVWDAAVEAFRDHPGFSEPTDNDFEEFLDRPWQDRTLWRVAWDGDEVAGQVRSFINEHENRELGRRRGWTEDISVRRPYRRRGLARSLLVQSLHAVAERGMDHAALGVMTENPNGAFDLYESVGFRVVRTWIEAQKPFE